MFSEASDIWSLGVVMWEIAAYGAFPLPQVKNADLLAGLKAGMRLPRPPNADNDIWSTICKCWAETPSDRPSFKALESMLTKIQVSLKLHRTFTTTFVSVHINCLSNGAEQPLVRKLENEGTCVREVRRTMFLTELCPACVQTNTTTLFNFYSQSFHTQVAISASLRLRKLTLIV